MDIYVLSKILHMRNIGDGWLTGSFLTYGLTEPIITRSPAMLKLSLLSVCHPTILTVGVKSPDIEKLIMVN